MTAARSRRPLPYFVAGLALVGLAAIWLRWAAVRDGASRVGGTREAGTTFDGQRALSHVEAQMALGPRPTGSPAHQRTGDYIIEQLEAAGWTAEVQPFTYQGVQARNIIGKPPDSHPDAPLVILGAHYDTRLLADQDPIEPDAQVPGANDGASGVGVLLELAFALDLDTIDGEVWLVFFDAEDNGEIDGWDWIVGSRYFVDNLTVNPSVVVVVDMIGDADQQIYYDRNSDQEMSRRLWQVADELGYGNAFVPEYRYSMLDDHTPFMELGIPAVDIIDFDYPYWHTTQDTLDKVSAESLERVGRTVQVFVEEGRWQPAGQGVGG